MRRAECKCVCVCVYIYIYIYIYICKGLQHDAKLVLHMQYSLIHSLHYNIYSIRSSTIYLFRCITVFIHFVTQLQMFTRSLMQL
jgi:hypothetical protein